MQKKREKIRTGCLAGIVLLLLAAVCLLFWNLQSEESRNNEKSKEYIQNQAQTKAENEQEITEDREKEKDTEEQKDPEEPKDSEEQKDTEESKDIEEQKDTEEQFQKATDERNQEQSSEKKENEEKQQKITEERDAAQNIGKGERVELKEEEQKNAAEKNTEEADAAEKSMEEADTEEKNTEETDAAEKSKEEADTEEKNTEEADAAEKNTEEAETEQKDIELKWTVAIDPGHQGSWVDMSEKEPNGPGSTEMKAMATTGTQGKYSGKPEYELNLEVSLLLREELEKRGYRVILTREDNDKAISNAQRAEYAYEEGGDIYVRIHANGSDHSGVSGALAMVPSPSNLYVGELAEESYRLAEAILNAYCEKASFSSLGIQYYDNMTGINWSKLPVMILEMGFMTNQTDDLRMADPEIQRLMAEGIADGIDQYFTEATGIELEK